MSGILHYQVVIVGAGPAGLSCARVAAGNGLRVLVLERKRNIGPKVCAGGITWSGLINKIPGQLEEKRFPSQHIKTRLQNVVIREQEPIIATVNREKLGLHMARIAANAGAIIQTDCRVSTIGEGWLEYCHSEQQEKVRVGFDYLVGADGSNSMVRRYLKIPSEKFGIGINYQLHRYVSDMEWHLDHNHFANGYGWIFPHAETVSIGAYCDHRTISAPQLHAGLCNWAKEKGYDLTNHEQRAERINFDYRGWNFGNIFLAGDAAGLASGLTGEGIYPAMVSGEHVGDTIVGKKTDEVNFQRLIRMQRIHAKFVELTAIHPMVSSSIAELVTLGLRSGLVDFRKIEMAH